jgi:hypothetical protein
MAALFELFEVFSFHTWKVLGCQELINSFSFFRFIFLGFSKGLIFCQEKEQKKQDKAAKAPEWHQFKSKI